MVSLFRSVPDHRVTARCIYPLSDLLTIALLTFICGGEDYVDMSEFAHTRARDFGLLVRLHAHNVITCQPLARSSSSFCWSRSLFRSIFACQNAVLVFGSTNCLHPSCPCQKQPLTNIAVLYLRITMSGLPCTLLTFNRYLYPCIHSHFLTANSGFVPLLRICDIQLWRCCGVIISGIVINCGTNYALVI